MKNRMMKLVFALPALFGVLLFSRAAFAQDATVEAVRAGNGGWIALAAGLTIGLAAFGGAIGQGRTAAAALDGIARNPGSADRVFTPLILGLALIESLVIYALIIAFLLQGKI